MVRSVLEQPELNGHVVEEVCRDLERGSLHSEGHASGSSSSLSAVDPGQAPVEASAGSATSQEVNAVVPVPVVSTDRADGSVAWRIDANASRPLPCLEHGTSRPDQDEIAGWRCDFWRQLPADGSSVLRRVVGRWAQQVEDFATRYVRNAFDGLTCHLQGVCAGDSASDHDVGLVLALAGSDVADHQATMRQLKQLVREQLAGGHVALVGLGDLCNPTTAVRRVCGQLLPGARCMDPASGDAVAVGDACESAAREEAEADRDPGAPIPAGVYDFLDWRREHGAGGPLVLLVEQADAAPKDALRNLLNTFGATCCDAGIPVLIVLGLHQPPQSRFDLLEGEPLVALRFLDTVCLFDAQPICAQLLEHMVQDPSCPLALTPDLLVCVRNEFLYKRHSVVHVLKILMLLCEQFLGCNELRELCNPLDHEADCSSMVPKPQLERIFCKRLAESPKALTELRVEWLTTHNAPGEDCGEGSESERCRQVAGAAAESLTWRWRLADSLGTWDALLRAVQPLSSHEVLLRRWWRLLDPLWPKQETGGPDIERAAVGDLLERCLRALGALSRSALDRLVQDLCTSSEKLDADLQEGLQRLATPAGDRSELLSGLKAWLSELRDRYWQPLTGAARDLFVQAFACTSKLTGEVERRLVGRKGLDSEALLLPAARGSAPSGEPPDDVALLCRLFECLEGRSVDVAELWRAFQEAAGGGEELLHRYGLGLVALHALGLQVPCCSARPGAQKEGSSGWRLRKRRFGRLWLQDSGATEPQPPPAAASAPAQPESCGVPVAGPEPAPATPPRAHDRRPPSLSPASTSAARVAVAEPSNDRGHREREHRGGSELLKRPPAAGQLKRPPAAWQPEDPAKRARVKERLAKVFMA